MSNLNTESILELFESINKELSFEKICELLPEQKKELERLYKSFVDINQKKVTDKNVPDNLRKQKGDALEELATYLLKVSENLFEIKKNIRTNTNEIDQLVELKPIGKLLCHNGVLDRRYQQFLGECKNYNTSISVTYVGKFCSLLLQSNIRLGILFSYHGITGKKWEESSGLIKKFYLHKEKIEERYCIINFSKIEFERIIAGDNFLQIVADQMEALQIDTDYTSFLSSHPAEGILNTELVL